MADHPMRGCHCEEHEYERAYQRNYHRARYSRDQAAQGRVVRHHRPTEPVEKRKPGRKKLPPHITCYCVDDDCPRVRIELLLTRDASPSQILAETGCSYEMYRAVLDRMSVAA